MKPSKDLKFLIKIVKNAAKLITNEFKIIDKLSVDNGDLVTTYDFEVEKYLVKKIQKKYPDFDIISEEFNAKNKLSDNCFTIDPIDGTINFANSIPLWGIQIAYIQNRKTVASIIYLPKFKELYSADENGAYLNNKKIKVNSFPAEKSIISATGKQHVEKLSKIGHPCVLKRNFYSACLDFAYVASGKIGGTIFTNDTLWDYTPGLFICKKAGAFISNEKGSHIAANSEKLLEILKQQL